MVDDSIKPLATWPENKGDDSNFSLGMQNKSQAMILEYRLEMKNVLEMEGKYLIFF